MTVVDDIPPSFVENAPPPVGMQPDLMHLHYLGSHAEVYNYLNPDPTAAPQISDVVATPMGDYVQITWTTDLASDSHVHYGLDESMSESTPTFDEPPNGVTAHVVGISYEGMTAGDTYHFTCASSNAVGETTSTPSTFVVEGEPPA